MSAVCFSIAEGCALGTRTLLEGLPCCVPVLGRNGSRLGALRAAELVTKTLLAEICANTQAREPHMGAIFLLACSLRAIGDEHESYELFGELVDGLLEKADERSILYVREHKSALERAISDFRRVCKHDYKSMCVERGRAAAAAAAAAATAAPACWRLRLLRPPRHSYYNYYYYY